MRIGHAGSICHSLRCRRPLGSDRAGKRLFGYLATRHQHGDDASEATIEVLDAQNRETRALHLKMDELLRSMDAARNRLINLEGCSDEEIDQIERQFKALKLREEREKAK